MREITLAHKGKQLRGSLVPENNVMGVSKIFIKIDASLENIKMVFNIPPQIVEDTISNIKTNGKRNILFNCIDFV